jgi:hypothetical protein
MDGNILMDNTTSQEAPLYALLNQINFAAQNGLHLVAIGMAVALPDICVSLISADGRSTGEKFKQWCTDNLTGDKFSFVTGDDLWSMRCGVLHNGRFGDLKHNVAKVIFTLPSGSSFTNCRADDAYLYGVAEFCNNLCQAVYAWHIANRDDQNVIKNMARIMQYYPQGLPPYIGGCTVIA